MMGVFVQVNDSTQRGRSDPLGYVIEESGCWGWVGTIDPKGYGAWHARGHDTRRAHRVMYEKVRGKIPNGLQLDHLCRNRACVNPDHLEVVDNRTNVLRGTGHTAQNARKTHCKRGHEFTPENTIVDGPNQPRPWRQCRACTKIRWQRQVQRNRQKREVK